MYIGIIGKGFVGGALGELLSKKHEVFYYDKFKECNNPKVLDCCDPIFICVPTPQNKTGEVDISIVEEAVSMAPDTNLVIKSTVPPGTTDRLAKKYNKNISFNPEFLRQYHANKDMENPQKLIVTNPELAEIYKGLIDCPIIITNNKTAEMMKYANNIMLAGQIGIANELYHICNDFGVNYDDVKECGSADPRIGNSHLGINHGGYRGYGGKCFPKDIRALIQFAEKNGMDLKIHKITERINNELMDQQGIENPEKFSRRS